MLQLKKMLVAAVLPLAAVATVAEAQNRPFASAIVQNDVVLNDNAVASMLDSMGMDYRTMTNDTGNTYHNVILKRGDWKFVINISISDSGGYLWLSSPLQKVPDGQSVSPEVLTKMLELNYTYGPTFFAYRPTSRQFFIQRSVANRGITAKVFREKLEEFLTDIQDTQHLWDPKKWQKDEQPLFGRR
jgi:hypothetical protein